MRSRPAAWQILIALSCGVALARSRTHATATSPVSASPLAGLPAVLEGQVGRSIPLSASEKILAAKPSVQLTRRAYGPSQAAMVTTTGFKELHPPEVCLQAAGYEVVERRVEQSELGCLGALRLRSRATDSLTHLYFTYTDGRTVSCRFWRRAGHAAWDLLAGRRNAWSSLQVMNPDPGQARLILLALLRRRSIPTRNASPIRRSR